MIVDSLNRYNKKIKFITLNEEYNPETSKTEKTPIVDSEQMAIGYELSANEELREFGEITRTHMTFTILGLYKKNFDYIYYNNEYYKLNYRQHLKLKEVFVVERISENFGILEGVV